jgi:hypothetical protein
MEQQKKTTTYSWEKEEVMKEREDEQYMYIRQCEE